MAWTVRPGRPEDTEAVLELFRATFGKEISAAAYRWKVADSPWPVGAPTAFVATAGDRVVGHFGGTPFRFRLLQREVSALHACDGMVAPEFRQEGVFTAVEEAAHAAWAAGGASLLLAVPTFSLKLRRRLDYRPMFHLGWLWRPLWRSAPLPQAGRGVEVSPLETPGAELDALWDAVKGSYDGLVVRDAAWLSYRYAAAGFDYRILLARAGGVPVGYLVYRREPNGRSASIADVFTALYDRPARAALVRAACTELRRAGVRAVRIFVAPGTLLSRDLRRAGFLPRRGAYDVSVVPLVPDLPWDVLRDPRRFFVMGGDFDVV